MQPIRIQLCAVHPLHHSDGRELKMIFTCIDMEMCSRRHPFAQWKFTHRWFSIVIQKITNKTFTFVYHVFIVYVIETSKHDANHIHNKNKTITRQSGCRLMPADEQRKKRIRWKGTTMMKSLNVSTLRKWGKAANSQKSPWAPSSNVQLSATDTVLVCTWESICALLLLEAIALTTEYDIKSTQKWPFFAPSAINDIFHRQEWLHCINQHREFVLTGWRLFLSGY